MIVTTIRKLRKNIAGAREKRCIKALEKMGYKGNNFHKFSGKKQRRILQLLAKCPEEYYLNLMESIKKKPRS